MNEIGEKIHQDYLKMFKYMNINYTCIKNVNMVNALTQLEKISFRARISLMLDAANNPVDESIAGHIDTISFQDVIKTLDIPLKRFYTLKFDRASEISANLGIAIRKIFDDIGGFTQQVVRYFSCNPSESLLFANVVYPALYGYFTVDEVLQAAFNFLTLLLSDAEGSQLPLTGLMFSATFNGFPYFTKALYSKFFKLLNEHTSDLTHALFLELLYTSITFAARFLTKQHYRAIKNVLNNYQDTDFLYYYFVKRVIVGGFDLFILNDVENHCMIPINVLKQHFDKICEPNCRREHATAFASCIFASNCSSIVSIPRIRHHFGSQKMAIITSVREYALIYKILKFKNALKIPDNLLIAPPLNPSMSPAIFDSYPHQLARSIEKEEITESLFEDLNYESDICDSLINESMRFKWECLKHELAHEYIPYELFLSDTYDYSKIKQITLRNSQDVLTYGMQNQLKEYHRIVKIVDELLHQHIHLNIIETFNNKWDEQYSIILHQMARKISNDYLSRANPSIPKSYEELTNQYPQSLHLYFGYALVDSTQYEKRFQKFLFEQKGMEQIRNIRRSFQSKVDKYCDFRDIRKSNLDRLAPRMKMIDSLNFGDGYMFLSNLVRTISTLVSDGSAKKARLSSVAKHFLYVYIKSDSENVMPVLINFMFFLNKCPTFKKELRRVAPIEFENTTIMLHSFELLLDDNLQLFSKITQYYTDGIECY